MLAAAIFISQNEYFTYIKNFLSSIFSFQKLLTCESHEVKDQIAPVKQVMLMEMT